MLQKSSSRTYFMVYAAAIAAIYTVLTMVFAPISFGPIQFRISEALCILPFFTPAAVPGLFIGCLLSNLLCGAAALDIILGVWLRSLGPWVPGCSAKTSGRSAFRRSWQTQLLSHGCYALRMARKI